MWANIAKRTFSRKFKLSSDSSYLPSLGYTRFSGGSSFLNRISPSETQTHKRGLSKEVLYLIEPSDEVAFQNLQTYKEKKLVDIRKEDLELGKEDLELGDEDEVKL
ncbi:hypothetical protein K1719_027908 [Acacia pycnantha]|nr:hypothetical protein K1719_027908 [Acacia pycnantha]